MKITKLIVYEDSHITRGRQSPTTVRKTSLSTKFNQQYTAYRSDIEHSTAVCMQVQPSARPGKKCHESV